MNVNKDKYDRILSSMDNLESQWDPENDELFVEKLASIRNRGHYRFQYMAYAAVISLLLLSNMIFGIKTYQNTNDQIEVIEDVSGFLIIENENIYDF